MKVKLPIIGLVQIGSEPEPPKRKREKLAAPGLGAGFLDLSDKNLSDQKTVSDKLIKSFYSWVFANVSAIAEEISKIEFEVFRPNVVKGEVEYKEVTQHPLIDLLDKPNPFTTTSAFIYQIAAHIELTGDAFILLDTPNNPKTMFILQPDRVTVNPGGTAENYEIISYTFKDTVDGKPVEKIYSPEYIIHIKTPNPGNPYRGKSAVEAAASSIDTSNLAREFLKMFFKNAAVPNFALTSDQRITDEDVRRIQAQLKKQYGGVFNAFKTLILGGGLKPVSVQQTGQQMQLLELLDHMRDEIMAMFKNTKASLGIVEDVNRANAEASLEGWKQSVIKPKMTRITDTLNEYLAPRFGQNLLIGFADPVPENRIDDIEEVAKLMSSSVRQVMTVNEARFKLGLDPLPIPEFDTIQEPQPIQLPTPIQDTTPKSLRNISLTKMMRVSGINQSLAEQKNMYEAAYAVAQKVIKSRRKKTVQIEDGKLPARDYAHLNFEEATLYHAKIVQLTEGGVYIRFDRGV